MRTVIADNVVRSRPTPLRRRVREAARLARNYAVALYRSRREEAPFEEVQSCCLFLGHARSGHSIVGALLDAHPDAVVPDEVDALRYVLAGFSREQLFHVMLDRAERLAAKGRTKNGREQRTYSYQVPGQWQGRYRTIRLIGETKAGITTQRLTLEPELLDRLRAFMAPIHLRFLHVVRNPFDNISTLMIRGSRTFENATEAYFRNCGSLEALHRRLTDEEQLVVRQEGLIEEPIETLVEICNFVGLTPTPDYLAACASILYASPARSRYKVEWSDGMIETVQAQIDGYGFLDGYRYDS